ncbi:MAG: 4-(cytidine 5'-diphospho)-2-C-methyl-D-erythritol kinase [Acidobacteriota bacterium]|nr:4-(cytidine 5'-diphospho)-2-C-methyl-D-erythritol kinase [Acidobacteriota bacterium]
MSGDGVAGRGGAAGTRVRSYSKINLGLAIGPARSDGFHGLTTIYQSLALHDVVTVRAVPAAATRLRLTTNHAGVPTDQRNTCWKMVERALEKLGVTAAVDLDIDKRLPVQGGMGAGSANAAAALLGLEHELAGWTGRSLQGAERLELAGQVGSDVPLFLLGGAVLGLGRGEQVVPLPDLPRVPCVVAIPEVGVSTPQAFRDWDARHAEAQLTSPGLPDRLMRLSLAYASCYAPRASAEHDTSGIVRGLSPESGSHDPEKKQGGSGISQTGRANSLAENTLLALVRTGAEDGGLQNDFESVVFPKYPSLRAIKHSLMGAETDGPALYAALSGSGSALFGLYRSMADAEAAQRRVQESGVKALITETLPRAEYWARMFAG